MFQPFLLEKELILSSKRKDSLREERGLIGSGEIICPSLHQGCWPGSCALPYQKVGSQAGHRL